MPVIRKVEIDNFRSIKRLSFVPSAGINCLVGPGDSGKSSILDAIDLCLGARRNLSLADTDFFGMDVNQSIRICVTIGKLDDTLKGMDAYGIFLRGFNAANGEIVEEPEDKLETVLSMELAVAADLEPKWTFISQRAAAEGITRNLNWNDRVRLAPTRIGHFAENNLSWRRGSVLNLVSDERVNAASALAAAARDARLAFGDNAKGQLGETLKIVHETATFLGVPVGPEVKALLDAHAISFSGGMISLHNADGIPLASLGLGSSRLLIAGLQRSAAKNSPILLLDELEQGLEPHRIIRLLHAIGSKEEQPVQVFATTHSPSAVCELSGKQLFIVRKVDGEHHVSCAGADDNIQGAIRRAPEALLASSILVAEGATEVGLIRGLDQHRVAEGKVSIAASGVAIVDGGGGSTFARALAFQKLGYRTAVLRDSDVAIDAAAEAAFQAAGGVIMSWGAGRALEDELFDCACDASVSALIDKAIEFKEGLVEEHVSSASNGQVTLEEIQIGAALDGFPAQHRRVLAAAAKANKGWFKSISAMEVAAREAVAPHLPNSAQELQQRIANILSWAEGK